MDWNRCYKDKETPWDKGAPAPPLVHWDGGGEMRGEILVPGCGYGFDAAEIAGRNPGSRITGADISPLALEGATRRHSLPNLEFVLKDIFRPDPELDGRFDWVFEHTCFCAIDPDRRDDYVGAVARLLKLGGNLVAIFYLNPYGDGHQPGGGPPHGTDEGELDRRFSGKFELLESWVPDVAYPGREGLELMRFYRLMV